MFLKCEEPRKAFLSLCVLSGPGKRTDVAVSSGALASESVSKRSQRPNTFIYALNAAWKLHCALLAVLYGGGAMATF